MVRVLSSNALENTTLSRSRRSTIELIETAYGIGEWEFHNALLETIMFLCKRTLMSEIAFIHIAVVKQNHAASKYRIIQRVPSSLVQQESCSIDYCASRDDACSRRYTTRGLE